MAQLRATALCMYNSCLIEILLQFCVNTTRTQTDSRSCVVCNYRQFYCCRRHKCSQTRLSDSIASLTLVRSRAWSCPRQMSYTAHHRKRCSAPNIAESTSTTRTERKACHAFGGPSSSAAASSASAEGSVAAALADEGSDEGGARRRIIELSHRAACASRRPELLAVDCDENSPSVAPSGCAVALVWGMVRSKRSFAF